jgi:glucose-6-phosphate isomerase
MPLAKSDYPISLQFDLANGTFNNDPVIIERRIAEMGKMFYDQESVAKIAEKENRLVYEMIHYYFETSKSDMSLAVSKIQPGKIGDEYHMTKGHFHESPDQPEIYFCLQGTGFLLLETLEGEFRAEPWKMGTITHIPPQWAHRVVNTGKDVLFYISSFHKCAGHVYDFIEENGFKNVVVEKNGTPVLIPNPKRQ